MDYICHRRYNKIGASGKKYLFRRKDVLNTAGNYIVTGTEAVCAVTSEDAYMYFARNDDGNGLYRGKLTYAIAYAHRKPNNDNDYRFTEDEISWLRKDYSKYLREDDVAVIFNYDFFNADIKELEIIAKRLGGE